MDSKILNYSESIPGLTQGQATMITLVYLSKTDYCIYILIVPSQANERVMLF